MDEKQLHGKQEMDNKVGMNPDTVDAAGDLGQSVRKAEVLHYIQDGGVEKELSAMGKEFIVHSEVDELYPR